MVRWQAPVFDRLHRLPWLTLQIIAANAAVILALGAAWYLAFMRQSNVYSERLMSTFNIEPGRLHAMYVDDVERQLWVSVIIGLLAAILASVGLAFLIVRPLRSLARATERLRHGDYAVRSTIERGEVGHLAKNFNALAEALEREDRRRAQYLADLSHELRTPITSLRGYTEGLEDGVFQADQSYFKLMASELNQLTTLTHSIDAMELNDTAIETQHDCIEATVGECVAEAKTRWDARFNQRGLQLDLDVPVSMSGRRLAVSEYNLRQIADNLLSNMVRYADESGTCQISVAKAGGGKLARLNFSNAAPGINHNTLPFLFDRFFRMSDSRTRKQCEHSSGLGLAIVKQLCLANQGNVIASICGNRLEIAVHLPLR
mgnify:CR=1 FL=1